VAADIIALLKQKRGNANRGIIPFFMIFFITLIHKSGMAD